MAKLTVETTFAVYELDAPLGEGGAGIVYAGTGPEGEAVAVKVLRESSASRDKRRRFKNEIGFLLRNRHANIVPVTDHGLTTSGPLKGPFYVMPRYDRSLRALMDNGIAPDRVLPLFSQVLDGVEAAHLLKAVHRDIKPENVLYLSKDDRLAVADFGIASFTDEMMLTRVETRPGDRMANFAYAAPEQRERSLRVAAPADIFALGCILNEMFTGQLPLGVGYRTIASVAEEYGYLDEVVALMLNQAPSNRPDSVARVKAEIERRKGEALARQRISDITGAVVSAEEIDEPLAFEPPRLVNLDYSTEGHLTLILDRQVTPAWVEALQHHMGGHTAVMGKGPERFRFQGNRAMIDASPHEVQRIVDHFKEWLPRASAALKDRLTRDQERQRAHLNERLRVEKEAEERRLQVLQSTRI